jgi:hypothetical protein
VGVDDACSGIRSFQASVMVAQLFGYSILRRGVLLFSAVVLAFACNVIRHTTHPPRPRQRPAWPCGGESAPRPGGFRNPVNHPDWIAGACLAAATRTKQAGCGFFTEGITI